MGDGPSLWIEEKMNPPGDNFGKRILFYIRVSIESMDSQNELN